MIEKYLNEENEHHLFKIPVVINTKNGEIVKLNAIIHDTKPEGTNTGTVIAIHGAPGSHRDFRRLCQQLEKEDIRVISINFPGYGYTDYDERLQNDNDERIQFVQQIIDALKLKEKLVFISHSRGSENGLKMAVNNIEKAAGVILVNPIGIRAHRGAKPLIVPIILTFLWKILWLRWLSNWLQYQLYTKVAKLKIKNGEICCVTSSLLAGLDYTDILPYINKFNESNVKAVLIYGGKDRIIETSISRELISCFKDYVDIRDEENDDETIQATLKEIKEERKTTGVFCQNGGHFLHRDRSKLIAPIIIELFKKSKCSKL